MRNEANFEDGSRSLCASLCRKRGFSDRQKNGSGAIAGFAKRTQFWISGFDLLELRRRVGQVRGEITGRRRTRMDADFGHRQASICWDGVDMRAPSVVSLAQGDGTIGVANLYIIDVKGVGISNGLQLGPAAGFLDGFQAVGRLLGKLDLHQQARVRVGRTEGSVVQFDGAARDCET